MTDTLTNRQFFLEDWAKQLGCPPQPHEVAAFLCNERRNFETACSVSFDLSWRPESEGGHQEYLRKASKYLRENWADGDRVDAAWMAAFVEHYITEVEKLP